MRNEKLIMPSTFSAAYVVQLVAVLASIFSVLSETNPFMDNDWFTINWSGYRIPTQRHTDEEGTTVVMMSSNKEQYSCFVPRITKNNQNDFSNYDGPSGQELIEHLHTESTCSYRIESFWTYELCHGKHLKQYHGDKDVEKVEGKMIFVLGNYEPKVPDIRSNSDASQPGDVNYIPPNPVKTKTLENIVLPYYEERMAHGTTCELTGQPREVAILYICQPEARGEIYQINEVATCQYEVIVLTAILCDHPSYKPQRPSIHAIECEGVNGAPQLPKKFEEYFPLEWPKVEMKHIASRRMTQQKTPSTPQRPDANLGDITDKQTLRSFFSGRHCIYGGSGWWRYEFCYMKHLTQYHQDAAGRTTIYLGKWNEQAHRGWMSDNPQLKASSHMHYREVLQLWYGDGEYCAKAKAKRQAIVKIMCIKKSNKPHSITLSLREPETCQYELVVESQLFCDVINQADIDGILRDPKL